MSTVTVAEVKTRLNKSLSVDDTEIQSMIDAAEAEYEQWVGPFMGSVTEVLDGGGTSLLLRAPNVASLTSVTYGNGSTVTLSDLTLDTRTGQVFWKYNTAGVFAGGCRNVTVVYAVASPSANHLEAIIADVAGYFEATQRGASGRPGEGYEAAYTATPQVLFPRIRKLAAPGVA